MLLITRPEPAASLTRTDLALRGYSSFVEPLTYRVKQDYVLPLSGQSVSGVIFTSAAAIEFFDPRCLLLPTWHSLPCYCVGTATARAAQRQGWQNLVIGHADGAALAALIMARHTPEQGALLHITGCEHRPEPVATLQAAGYAVQIAEIYQAVAQSALSAGCIVALQNRNISAALFFSPRCVDIFHELSAQAGVAAMCHHLTAYCLSPAIAARAAVMPWQQVFVANQPDYAAMLEQIAGG